MDREEYECEIKILEYLIDEKLKNSFHFKGESVTGKTVFEIELLKVKINSKSEYTKAVQIATLLLSVFITLVVNLILKDLGDLFSLILALVIITAIGISGIRLSKTHRRATEADSYGLGLIDLLIERKKLSNQKPQ